MSACSTTSEDPQNPLQYRFDEEVCTFLGGDFDRFCRAVQTNESAKIANALFLRDRMIRFELVETDPLERSRIASMLPGLKRRLMVAVSYFSAGNPGPSLPCEGEVR